LIASGWLIPLDADQWALNRWGAHFRINLQWSRLHSMSTLPGPVTTITDLGTPATDPDQPILGETLSGSGPELAPPTALAGLELAPPESHKEPLNGSEKNQKPASGPAGISISNRPKIASEISRLHKVIGPLVPPAPTSLPDPAPVPQKPIPAAFSSVTPGSSPRADCLTKPVTVGQPDLRNVVPEDLKNTSRLLWLFDQAVARGWVTASECDRLRFVGAAEHARAIGTRNPCGLFVRLVRSGLWSFLTQDDEDVARVRLKRHLYGMAPIQQSPASLPVREVVFLSDDARLVRSIRVAVARTRYRGDAFPLLKRERPEWTRERWDRALTELVLTSPSGSR
jgi:hypothetical protein